MDKIDEYNGKSIYYKEYDSYEIEFQRYADDSFFSNEMMQVRERLWHVILIGFCPDTDFLNQIVNVCRENRVSSVSLIGYDANGMYYIFEEALKDKIIMHLDSKESILYGNWNIEEGFYHALSMPVKGGFDSPKKDASPSAIVCFNFTREGNINEIKKIISKIKNGWAPKEKPKPETIINLEVIGVFENRIIYYEKVTDINQLEAKLPKENWLVLVIGCNGDNKLMEKLAKICLGKNVCLLIAVGEQNPLVRETFTKIETDLHSGTKTFMPAVIAKAQANSVGDGLWLAATVKDVWNKKEIKSAVCLDFTENGELSALLERFATFPKIIN